MISRTNHAEIRPDVSHVSSNGRPDFMPLSREERVTYVKWRRGAFALYGAIVICLGGLMLVQIRSAGVAPELRAAPQVTLAKTGG